MFYTTVIFIFHQVLVYYYSIHWSLFGLYMHKCQGEPNDIIHSPMNKVCGYQACAVVMAGRTQ